MQFLKKLFKRKPRVKKTDIKRRFDIVAQLGHGSMSKVWRARDTLTGRNVALKVLDIEKMRRYEARFVGLDKPTEGEVSVTLMHPHIVRAFEHGHTRRREQFLVMEYIDGVGMSLYVDMQNEAMKTHRLNFMIQLGSAIAYLHSENWIHRDICPRNVLIDRDRQVKLIDFGLTVPNTPKFQAPGNRTGTANYMAPELIKRRPTDQRIDIYSYAVTCYEMFAKKLPFDVDVGMSLDMVLQHINVQPRDIREHVPDIDETLAATIMTGLERDPNDRWHAVEEMVRHFREARARLQPEFAEDKASTGEN